ncbi:hypothetical protein ACHAXA_004645 [Cyclostephanos tholiformis]|uniref:Peptidase M14 domain-containing protein n=1 Tax=Cyclostephanos tholiformis TaxID=382380 RepID=A0ABD3RCF8_9STRA
MHLFEQLAGPFLIFYLISISTTASAKPTTTATGNATETSFPRIYVANILTPDADPSTVTRFPAEVDLLGFDRITETTSKISFMVHDEEDLTRLSRLARTPTTKTIGRTIEIDLEATNNLHMQIESRDDGGMGETMSLSSTVYTTIANYPCYKSLLGSFAWMDGMVAKGLTIRGLNVTKSDIGDSYLKTKNAASGYDIWALTITGNAAVPAAKKGILFMMSGIHARELAPPELASRWVETLINGYGNDADISSMLDSTVIHLVLQANPDGRQVAETYPNVMRRKNMNPGTSTSCNTNNKGVDLNRNFPYQWGLSSGSSSNPCSSTYRGASAGSEPEVKAIINYTKAIFPAAQRKANAQTAYAENTTIGVFLDIHAYGNLILPPWSYSTSVLPPNRNAITAITDKVKYWTNYGGNLGYLAAGTTKDYAFKELGAASFTFELGTKFYQDCTTFENTINPNNQKPLMHLAKISRAPYSMSQGPDITRLNVTEYNGNLTITAIASDSAWSKANVATAQQSVAEIRAWVDIHPHSLSNLDNTGSVLVNGRVNINVTSMTAGRYSVYVQAKDSAGYRGPVTAAFFNKI